MKNAKKRLGDILLEAKAIRLDQLTMALEQQKRWGGRLASILIEMGSVDEKTISAVLEEQLGYKCMMVLSDEDVKPEALKMVSSEKARKYHVVPLKFAHGRLTLAMSDPTDIKTIDELSFSIGVEIDPVCSSESCIAKAIQKYYGSAPSKKPPSSK